MDDLVLPRIGMYNAGYAIIAAVQFPLPADDFLFTVIGKKGDAYVVWTYNAQSEGFAHGTYFTMGDDNRAECFQYFAARLVELNVAAFSR